MTVKFLLQRKLKILLIILFFSAIGSTSVQAQDRPWVTSSNFGLPGIIDLPNARRFPDGELIISQQIHKSLARSSISFQALPHVGLAFRYSGHGIGGGYAYGRLNHDRSFDAHISVFEEKNIFPKSPSV